MAEKFKLDDLPVFVKIQFLTHRKIRIFDENYFRLIINDLITLQVIRNKLRPLRKGMRANIIDNMVAMMEKYADNLEVLVDERTHLLIEEKRKTDALLQEMLPKPVAEQLKQV